MKIKKFNEMFDPMGSWNPNQLKKEIKNSKEVLEDIINELKDKFDLEDVKFLNVLGDDCVHFNYKVPFSINILDRGKTIQAFVEIDGITDSLGSYNIDESDEVVSMIVRNILNL